MPVPARTRSPGIRGGRPGCARCEAWFLGANDAGISLVDNITGGGCDGLHRTGRNENQGAESTLAMISTFQLGRPVRDPMTTDLLRRVALVLRADPSRVIAKLFLPGQETLANGISRADQVIHRVLAMTADQVTRTLTDTMDRFGDRHAELPAILRGHFELVAHRLPAGSEVSDDRAALIGAYFTQEYSIEAAALFNPSMVAHPDQSGLEPGELRFVMSVRAVGEGHVSSIEFRTGVLTDDGDVRVDDDGPAPDTRPAGVADASRGSSSPPHWRSTPTSPRWAMSSACCRRSSTPPTSSAPSPQCIATG